MKTRTINSTAVQNNFGQIIDAVVHGQTRYIVKRRNVSQAIIMSLEDFVQLLSDASERKRISTVIRELTPVYNLGETINTPKK